MKKTLLFLFSFVILSFIFQNLVLATVEIVIEYEITGTTTAQQGGGGGPGGGPGATSTTIQAPSSSSTMSYLMPNNLSSYANETLKFSVVITNKGNSTLHDVRLYFLNVSDATFYIDPLSIEALPVNGSQTFSVEVNLSKVSPGNYSLGVMIKSQEATYTKNINLFLNSPSSQKEEEKTKIEEEPLSQFFLLALVAISAISVFMIYKYYSYKKKAIMPEPTQKPASLILAVLLCFHGCRQS